MTTNQLVKDYKGNLVPRNKSRKIKVGDGYKFYVEDVSCFLMEDGQWYRIDSPKIIYDNYKKKYVMLATTEMISGIINEKGEIGKFSASEENVTLMKQKGGAYDVAMTPEIAEKLGYEECIGDGLFYKTSTLTEQDRTTWFVKKDIPKNERSTSYNLEQDPDKKARLIKIYDESTFPISMAARRLGKLLGRYSVGMEVEVINGFIPKRIRNKYGLKALKDGSLRSDTGEGIEYVTMPMMGVKCIQTIINVMAETAKRCEINNYCSLHFHFGNVRKDKLYILSFYKLITLVQGELMKVFPYSRFNTIKPDGKVYCKPLEDLSIDYNTILDTKNEDAFRAVVVKEFNKIYSWLNGGKSLAEEFAPASITRQMTEMNGKKGFYDTWLKNVYTTKSTTHAFTGQKWDKPTRYYIVNLLNLFFNQIGTIEFRCHESTTNATKAICWLLICLAILNYAENVKEVFLAKTISIHQVLSDSYDKELVYYLLEYLKMRNSVFFTATGQYRQNFKNIEANWFLNDPTFAFESTNKYKLI